MPDGDPTAMWRRSDDRFMHEELELRRIEEGFQLVGRIAGEEDGEPLLVQYLIECDEAWRSRFAGVTQVIGATRRTLRLIRTDFGDWLVDSEPVPQLAGCEDIDLSITPSTNFLPIRRLQLPLGRSATVTAAWVKFPELVVAPLEQSYSRAGPRRYRYRSLGSGFAVELYTDADGFPLDYGSTWQRLRQA